jgi:hypothetical protein
MFLKHKLAATMLKKKSFAVNVKHRFQYLVSALSQAASPLESDADDSFKTVGDFTPIGTKRQRTRRTF